MLYIENNCCDPHFNLALEEYVLNNLDGGNIVFLLWQNEPSVIVGRNQNTIEEINVEYIKEKGINVVRRISGGGAVYHDLGNLNYTFLTKLDEGNSSINFRKFTEPVIKVLRDLGVPAEFSGRNDIIIEGKKFSGNAQYYYKDKVLHHGTLLFSSDLTEVQKALNVTADKFQSKGVKSVRSRVTNISDYLSEKITIQEFKNYLKEKIFENAGLAVKERNLTDKELEEITKLMKEKYLTWEWNYGSSPRFNYRKSQRFSAGKIEILLEVKKGIIESCKIYGDFFGTSSVSDLEEILTGKKYNEEDIKHLLEKVDLNKYFRSLELEEFLSLIF